MKKILPLFLVLSTVVLGSPTAVIELDKKSVEGGSYRFEIVRENPEERRHPSTLEIEAKFPSRVFIGEDRTFPLRSVEIADQAFFCKSKIEVNESLIKEGNFSMRVTVPKSALNDTSITGIFGYGDILVYADLGVILGDELSPQEQVEKERLKFGSELIRILPESEEAIRSVEYLKRDRVEELLLSHRSVKEGIELIVEGSGLRVEVDRSIQGLEINLSVKGFDRYRSLQFALRHIDAKAIVTEQLIKIEPQPGGTGQPM